MNEQTSPEQDLATRKIIEIINMHKWFGDFHVLSDISLKVDEGEQIGRAHV